MPDKGKLLSKLLLRMNKQVKKEREIDCTQDSTCAEEIREFVGRLVNLRKRKLKQIKSQRKSLSLTNKELIYMASVKTLKKLYYYGWMDGYTCQGTGVEIRE